MSITDQLTSIIHDDHIIPLDLYYTNFLKSLSEIHDEGMRDRCHKYWTSLYRYFDRSMTNERALILEEKLAHEKLHRLDIEMASRQSEIAYQIRNILQQGQQVLSDLHLKYKTKKNNNDLKEIEGNKIHKQKSEHSLIFDFNKTSSSTTTLQQITDTIDNLKSEIKDLQITREHFQTELNNKKMNYFSTYIKTYHIQQNIYKMIKEFNEIQHQLTFNLKTIDEQINQLNLCNQQNLPIFINQKDQLIKQQIDNEQKLLLEFKEQNKELNNCLLNQIIIFKTNENKQLELNFNNKELLEKISIKQEEIEKEKKFKQEFSRIFIKLKIELKNKQKLFSINSQQINILKNKIIELEHKHNVYQHQYSTPEIVNQSTDNIKKTINQQVNQRLKLTIIHHNIKHEINNLESTTQQYTLIVKDQRQQIINYEKLHDKWILNININRKRLIELFNRINILTQYINNTKNFLDHFNKIKLSLRSNILIIYNKMNLFIQQRKEKNNIDTNLNESKNSLNIKLNSLKKFYQSNQIIFDQLKQNIFLINKNSSLLFNQISILNKQRLYLIEYNNNFQNKQQQLLNMKKKFNQIKSLINLNEKQFQKFKYEKEKIIYFLLEKQHMIIFLNKSIEFNQKKLIKYQLNYNQLQTKIQQQILRNISLYKLSQNQQQQINLKQSIISLRKELFKYKKKTNDFQYKIHRRHFTQQILTKFNNKSIGKENNEQYHFNLQEKLSTIIYRLICKTQSNIILHKRLDLLMENILLLYFIDKKSPLKNIQINNSCHLNNQLKSSIAELRVLKNEILFYKQIYIKIKYSLENYFFV